MEFKIKCPWCNQHYSVDTSFIGQKVECSVCEKEFIVRKPTVIVSNRKLVSPHNQQYPHGEHMNQQQGYKKGYGAQNTVNPQQQVVYVQVPPKQKNNGEQHNSQAKQGYSGNSSNVEFSFKRVLLGVLIYIGFIVLVSVSCSLLRTSSSSSSPHVEINNQYHMTSGAVGFSSKESLEKCYQFYLQKDNAARMSYLTAHMATGDAVMFSGGETVTVSELSPWSDMAKVRNAGSTSEYWVYTVWLE